MLLNKKLIRILDENVLNTRLFTKFIAPSLASMPFGTIKKNILLNKTEGKKHQEIADMLGLTKKVVEYRIYSAFKIIKSKIKELK